MLAAKDNIIFVLVTVKCSSMPVKPKLPDVISGSAVLSGKYSCCITGYNILLFRGLSRLVGTMPENYCLFEVFRMVFAPFEYK